MAKWLLVVETNCADAAGEAEFNEWYDKTHLPDVLETPGFIRATRYENTEPSEGEAKFLATYEIETNDIDRFMKAHNANVARKRAEGRFSELLVLVSRGFYRTAQLHIQVSCQSARGRILKRGAKPLLDCLEKRTWLPKRGENPNLCEYLLCGRYAK